MNRKDNMKELTIIIAILILIIGGNYFVNKYLEKSSNELIGDLNKLRIEIKEKSFQNDYLTKKGNEIYDKWQIIDEKWAMIVLHSELDMIETSLIKMKTEIEENNLDIALEELETSIFLINHISEKEKLCLKNIF